MTRGVIKTGRRSEVYPDADIILSGHIHESWTMRRARMRLSEQNRIYYDEVLHIQHPSYKGRLIGRGRENSVPDLCGDWEREREFAPQPAGAVWLRFSYPSKERGLVVEVEQAR